MMIKAYFGIVYGIPVARVGIFTGSKIIYNVSSVIFELMLMFMSFLAHAIYLLGIVEYLSSFYLVVIGFTILEMFS